ncbi:phospholipase A2-like isoform X1 [Sparus aurata]|uniref:phospholipase A2-like isoform X1 n=1 Tax=Sparus aurata TaxID=8175 RepID=UPI0011C15A8D|nr:phospholipase A2-like isoform X1 [Sparus aurata]
MNLSGPLLLLLLTAACVVSGQRGSRAFWQFGNMIRCVQSGVNPFKYNNYGSYCGLRRRGTPVDEVDLCCKVHDECYAAQMRNSRCRGFFSQPYRYQYSCSGGQPTCSATNDCCKAAACECDRKAALCLAWTRHNPEHKNLDAIP